MQISLPPLSLRYYLESFQTIGIEINLYSGQPLDSKVSVSGFLLELSVPKQTYTFIFLVAGDLHDIFSDLSDLPIRFLIHVFPHENQKPIAP